MTKPLTRTNKPKGLYWIDPGGKRIPGLSPGLWGDYSGIWGDCTGLWSNCSGLRGEISGIWGNCRDLWGDCTGLRGDCTGLRGDLNLIPDSARPCDIADWVVP